MAADRHPIGGIIAVRQRDLLSIGSIGAAGQEIMLRRDLHRHVVQGVILHVQLVRVAHDQVKVDIAGTSAGGGKVQGAGPVHDGEIIAI